MTDTEILNEFGELVTKNGFDDQYGSLLEVLSGDGKKFERLRSVSMLFDRFDADEKSEIKKYVYTLLTGTLFGFLTIFEENEQFKIIHEENGKQTNLVEISEMLKAEPIIEGGWIERFSKEIDKEGLL